MDLLDFKLVYDFGTDLFIDFEFPPTISSLYNREKCKIIPEGNQIFSIIIKK